MKPANGLLPKFSKPVADSQRTFRTIMNAMAHPGRIYELPVAVKMPAPLYPSTGAVCLTLLDLDTPVWVDPLGSSSGALEYLKFHCGCPLSRDSAGAAFAIMADGRSVPSLSRFKCGDPLYPESSTTVIIQVESLGNSPQVLLSGPGIKTEVSLQATGLNQDFWPDFKANSDRFPLGVDVLLASPESICGLPRTVKVARSSKLEAQS